MASDQNFSDLEAELETLRRRVRPASQHLTSLAKPSSSESSSIRAGVLRQVAGPKSIYALLMVTALAALKAAPKFGTSNESASANTPSSSSVVNARTGLLLGVAGVMGGMWLSRVVPPTTLEQNLVAEYKPRLTKSIDAVLEASVGNAKTQLAEGFGLSRWIGLVAVLMGLAAQNSMLQ